MESTGITIELEEIILPGGSLGGVLLKGLLSEPTFTISVLVRKSSSSLKYLPSGIKVFKIPNDYPYHELVEAFKGQDAIVNAITSTQIEEQFRFIDAAIEAGVKQYVPSEYGLNSLNPDARALNAVFEGEGRVQEYPMSKGGTGLTWHAIGYGMWIDWFLKHSFLGLDYANRTITFADEGKGKFSISTMANTAIALNHSLLNPAATKNKAVYISDFAMSQDELVHTMERVSGEKWTVKSVDSRAVIAESQKKVAEGDGVAVYKLIEMGLVTGRYGAWLEEKEMIWNDVLDLPKEDRDEVVRKALESMES